jgi:CMP-N,N'-diacetyllegionaminic acid synthase
MKIVSVILARGGSKGIPKKNLISLKGKPLISYTIEASILSNVHETWVSSDCENILSVSEKFGAKTLHRPVELATDFSSSEDALCHFADNVNFDVMVFIQPTSPLLKSSHINSGLHKVIDGGFDSAFSGFWQHWIPTWRKTSMLSENGSIQLSTLAEVDWHRYHRPRRQDRQEVFVENGACYITKKELFYANKNRYSGNIGYIEMLPSESFQVDTFDDLHIIEKILE